MQMAQMTGEVEALQGRVQVQNGGGGKWFTLSSTLPPDTSCLLLHPHHDIAWQSSELSSSGIEVRLAVLEAQV